MAVSPTGGIAIFLLKMWKCRNKYGKICIEEGVFVDSKFKDRKKILKKEYEVMLADSEFTDISPDNIEILIRFDKDSYIVFVDKDLELDWQTTNAYDNLHSGPDSDQKCLLNSVEMLQHSPTVSYLDKKKRIEFIRLLGESWVYALDECYDLAKETSEAARNYLLKRNYEISRKWQLIGSFAVSMIIIFGFVISKWNTYLAFGCIGALFSIIYKSGKIDYDCEAGKFLNGLEIISRFVASIISAYIIVQLFNLNLIFSTFKASEQHEIAIILLCFIAGFSERLVPSIISRIESEEEKGEKSTNRQ